MEIKNKKASRKNYEGFQLFRIHLEMHDDDTVITRNDSNYRQLFPVIQLVERSFMASNGTSIPSERFIQQIVIIIPCLVIISSDDNIVKDCIRRT